MFFNALLQDGRVYLVPASLEVPVARRNALRPVEVLGSWSQVPPADPAPDPAPPALPAPAPAPPAPPEPAPAPPEPAPEAVAPVVAPAAPPPEVKEQSGERRKGR